MSKRLRVWNFLHSECRPSEWRLTQNFTGIIHRLEMEAMPTTLLYSYKCQEQSVNASFQRECGRRFCKYAYGGCKVSTLNTGTCSHHHLGRPQQNIRSVNGMNNTKFSYFNSFFPQVLRIFMKHDDHRSDRPSGIYVSLMCSGHLTILPFITFMGQLHQFTMLSYSALLPSWPSASSIIGVITLDRFVMVDNRN